MLLDTTYDLGRQHFYVGKGLIRPRREKILSGVSDKQDLLGQVWYLIVSIPDLCTLTYF